MNTVRMSHPELEQVIEVAPSAVPFHGAAGWVVVEETAVAPEQEAKSKTPSRRKTSEESD